MGDNSACHVWEVPNCSVALPGVASNTDITITNKADCDALDNNRGMCEWRPTRPDTVPEPQPPNLLNKCVCFACQGPLHVNSNSNSWTPGFPTPYQSTII